MDPEGHVNPYQPPAEGSELAPASPGEVAPFTSVFGLIGRAFSVFFGNLGTIAGITLAVFAPVEIVKNLLEHTGNLQDNAGAAMRIEGTIEFIFGSLVTPALILALTHKLETGRDLGVGKALSAGTKRWGAVLGAQFRSGLFSGLAMLALIVPGILLAVRYALVSPVATLEVDRNASRVLRRSTEIVTGHGWKVFGVGFIALFIVMFFQLAGGAVTGAVGLWPVEAVVDCLNDVIYRFVVVAMLLVYLGLGGRTGRGAPEQA